MSNHKSSGPQSQHLCETLFEQLEKEIGPLIYEQGKAKCTIGNAKGIFACVTSHTKAYGSITILFRGDADQAKKFRALTISTAAACKPYDGSFKVRDKKQLREAVRLLSTVSHLTSAER
jgi:hypothetical protein